MPNNLYNLFVFRMKLSERRVSSVCGESCDVESQRKTSDREREGERETEENRRRHINYGELNVQLMLNSLR